MRHRLADLLARRQGRQPSMALCIRREHGRPLNPALKQSNKGDTHHKEGHGSTSGRMWWVESIRHAVPPCPLACLILISNRAPRAIRTLEGTQVIFWVQ